MYSVALMTIIRDKDTAKREFVEAAKKLSTMIFNEAISLLPHAPR
jgi:uracil phosphoribosyltransferase